MHSNKTYQNNCLLIKTLGYVQVTFISVFMHTEYSINLKCFL